MKGPPMSTTVYEIARRNLMGRIAAHSDRPLEEALEAKRRGIDELDCLLEEIRRAEVSYEQSLASRRADAGHPFPRH